jgi:hypothetical protein
MRPEHHLPRESAQSIREVLDYIQPPALSPEYLAAVLNDHTWQDEVVRNPGVNLRYQICSSWLLSSAARAQCMIANTILDLRSRISHRWRLVVLIS